MSETFSIKFRNSKITKASLNSALKVYVNGKNGKFYCETYNKILKVFPKSSIHVRVLLTLSWTRDHKPNPDKFRDLRCLKNLPSFTDIKRHDIDEILKTYDVAEKVLGSVTASKYLHFLFPNTFLMWDGKIQNFVFGKRLPSSGNKEKYANYLTELKNKYCSSSIGKQLLHNYSIPRLLDIWLWSKSR